jgi:hypothetical protein
MELRLWLRWEIRRVEERINTSGIHIHHEDLQSENTVWNEELRRVLISPVDIGLSTHVKAIMTSEETIMSNGVRHKAFRCHVNKKPCSFGLTHKERRSSLVVHFDSHVKAMVISFLAC